MTRGDLTAVKEMLQRLGLRFLHAYEAFRDEPPEQYLLVEWVNPLGWRVLNAYATYDEAFQTVRGEQRIMTESTWKRQTLERMAGQSPWIAAARLNARAITAESDAATYRTMLRVNWLERFQETKHP